MNKLKMAARLRRLADQLESENRPEPSIRSIDFRMYAYDRDGNEAVITQFFLLPNTLFSTGRIPSVNMEEGFRVEARPLL